MARGTSIPITTVVINGPMAERSYPSWESDNAVIVKENKTTHSSTWGAKDLCEICIWKKFLRGRILLCKVAMMQQRALATACHSQGLWRENALRLVFVNKFDTRFNIRVPFALPNWKPSITLPTTWIFINWTTYNSRTVKEVCFKLQLNNNNNNSGQIWLNFHASFSRFVSQQCRANLCCKWKRPVQTICIWKQSSENAFHRSILRFLYSVAEAKQVVSLKHFFITCGEWHCRSQNKQIRPKPHSIPNLISIPVFHKKHTVLKSNLLHY